MTKEIPFSFACSFSLHIEFRSRGLPTSESSFNPFILSKNAGTSRILQYDRISVSKLDKSMRQSGTLDMLVCLKDISFKFSKLAIASGISDICVSSRLSFSSLLKAGKVAGSERIGHLSMFNLRKLGRWATPSGKTCKEVWYKSNPSKFTNSAISLGITLILFRPKLRFLSLEKLFIVSGIDEI